GRDGGGDGARAALERWGLHRTAVLAERVDAAYDAYEFHTVAHALNNFCSVDMSALYLDVRKDCLYCERPASAARRATQTTLHGILDVLVRLMAPVLSFTADEIWQFLPGTTESSVLLAGLPRIPPAWKDDALATRFELLLTVRGAMTKAIEEARQGGLVKQPSEARIVLAPTPPLAERLGSAATDLTALMTVSEILFVPLDGV